MTFTDLCRAWTQYANSTMSAGEFLSKIECHEFEVRVCETPRLTLEQFRTVADWKASIATHLLNTRYNRVLPDLRALPVA